MDVHTAQHYHDELRKLFSALQQAHTVQAREPIVIRMQNLAQALYVVNSNAVLHIEEALRKLKYPELAIVGASHATIATHLRRVQESIHEHQEPHFVLLGQERILAKPVVGDELRSLVEKGRLFHEDHRKYVSVFDAPDHIADTFIDIDVQTLRPALERLGFPHAEAIVFFRTKAVPSLVAPIEQIPSLRLCTLRSGVPITVLKHRSL
jgi:hypothetical protein